MKTLVADNKKNGILGNIALAAEENYRGLFDNANDAIITTDIIGRVTSWNKTAEKLFGWTAQEITGKRLVEALSTPETADVKEKMICEVLPDTKAGLEIECMHRDGTKIDVSVTISTLLDIDRNIAGKSLIIRDITEHKRHEIALHESEEKYRNLVERSNDGILIIQDGLVKFANARLAQLWGGGVEELLETPMIRHIHPDERDKVMERYQRRVS